MKYNSSFLDTYKKYITKGWYDSALSAAKLNRWVENFIAGSSSNSIDPQICAHFLLNSLIFYQEKHLEAIIHSIESKLMNSLNASLESKTGHRLTEGELHSAWGKYKEQCCIVAATNPNAAGDSAHQASRVWRKLTHIEPVSINQLLDEIENHGKTHIFFVDDFVGTGTKMHNFLSLSLATHPSQYEIKTVEDVIHVYCDSVDFNIAVYAIHEQGYNKIIRNFPSIKFYYGDYYTKEYDLLSEECRSYDLFSDYKAGITTYLSEKQSELDGNNPYGLNLPIAFHHGCPNNSLALYYKSSPTWVQLFTESHPK